MKNLQVHNCFLFLVDSVNNVYNWRKQKRINHILENKEAQTVFYNFSLNKHRLMKKFNKYFIGYTEKINKDEYKTFF